MEIRLVERKKGKIKNVEIYSEIEFYEVIADVIGHVFKGFRASDIWLLIFNRKKVTNRASIYFAALLKEIFLMRLEQNKNRRKK